MRGFRGAFRELVIEPFIPELPDDGLAAVRPLCPSMCGSMRLCV